MEKEKGTIKCSSAFLVVVIFLILGFVCGYAVRKQKPIECPKSVVNINEVVEKVESGSVLNDFEIEKKDDNYIIVEKSTKDFFDASELNVKPLSDYPVFNDISDNANIVETIDFGNEYYAKLDITGNVNITSYKNDTSVKGNLNISNVIDIIDFSIPADYSEQLLYLLTDEGSVYSYRIGDSADKKYDVKKIDNVSNVKKLFISNYSKPNAGGSWALFAITENNDCIMINATGV